MIKKLLRWAKITGQRDNSKQFAVQQVTYKGKVADCLIIFPYGVDANLTDDCLVAMLAMEGNSENRAGIGWTPKDRLNLEEGENGFYHPPTGVFFKYDKNGNAALDTTSADGNVTINTGSGNVAVNTTQATITASSSVTVDTPNTTFTGNVQIDGALNVDGDITGLSDIIATALLQGATLTITGNGSIGGKDFLTHGHNQGNDSDGDSQVTTGGVA